MIVTLEEMKQYLRVDFEDDDQLISDLIYSSISLCKDVLRTDDDEVLALAGNGKIAVMYAWHIYMNIGKKLTITT